MDECQINYRQYHLKQSADEVANGSIKLTVLGDTAPASP
jgi:hypothetical protein